jgi:hypothetical protein
MNNAIAGLLAPSLTRTDVHDGRPRGRGFDDPARRIADQHIRIDQCA